MGWTQRGTGTSVAITAGTGNQTVSLPATTERGDLIIVAVAGDISCANSVQTSGYTLAENGTGANPGAHFAYRVSPGGETTVAILKDGTVVKSCVVQIWSGGNSASILDASITTAATGSSANPNSGAITVVGDNSLVVTIAYLDDDDTTVTTQPSGYSNTLAANTGQASTTVGSTVAIASLVRSGGSEDPGQWTLGSSDQWAAQTISFKLQAPQAPTQTKGEVAVTGYAPTAIIPVVLTPTTGQLVAESAGQDFTVASGSTDYPFTPTTGALGITGYAPLAKRVDSWAARYNGGNNWFRRVESGAYAITQTAGALAVTSDALTPTVESANEVTRAPEVGALEITGYAPTVGVSYVLTPETGQLTASGDPQQFAVESLVEDFPYYPSVGALTVTGYAPSLLREYVLTPETGQLVITADASDTLEMSGEYRIPTTGALSLAGYAPSLRYDYVEPQTAGALTITGYAPTVLARQTIEQAAGAVDITGFAPDVTATELKVLTPATAQLGVEGFAPEVVRVNKVAVTFPFATTTDGFVATPGTRTTMAHAPTSGNPGGSLYTNTTGKNTTAVNVWRLATDWASLGIPENKIVTGISLKSAQSRCTTFATGRASTVSAVTLTPTGHPAITIAASRSFSATDPLWTTQTAADTTGLEIASSGSLTITLGSNLLTGVLNSASIALLQDNVTFTVEYTDSRTLRPGSATVTLTGFAPELRLDSTLEVTSWFRRLTDGFNTWSERFGVGSGKVFEPETAQVAAEGYAPKVDFGSRTRTPETASLGVTGYAPTVIGNPIHILGADYWDAQPATLESTSVRVITQSDKWRYPTVADLSLAGYAPTVTVRPIIIPLVGQLTITGYAPTVTRDLTASVTMAELGIEGYAPYVLSEPRKFYPATAELGITGAVPTMPERPVFTPITAQLEVGWHLPITTQGPWVETVVGAAEITGYAPTLAYGTGANVPSAQLGITADAPYVDTFRAYQVTATFTSEPATMAGTGNRRERTSAALQAEPPLLFAGTGKRQISGSGNWQAGLASLSGTLSAVEDTLNAEPAVLYAQARHIPFHAEHRRMKPERVNRYTVALKPSPRLRIRTPNKRKPTR